MKQKFLVSLLLAVFVVLTIILQTTVRTKAQEEENIAHPKSSKAAAEFVPGEVIVRFRESAASAKTSASRFMTLRTSEREISAEIVDFDGSKIVSGLRLARVAPEDTLLAIDAFNSRSDVLYAEPNYIRRKLALPNDPRFGELWGLKNTGQLGYNDATAQNQAGKAGADIDAELAWNITTGSRAVVVGIIDEGIDINHPDLRDNIWRNPGEVAGNGVDDDGNGFIDDVNGWDFYHNDASVYDGAAGDNTTDSHGTHVAGTIGATGNNAIGVTGVNWQVSIMSLKILPKACEPSPSCDPYAPATVSTTVRAFSYARMMRQRGVNLRVLNNSYGGGGKSQAELDAIRALNDVGILFVAAAGNDAVDSGGFPHFPANYDAPNVIAVAATNRFDDIAVFSTYGTRTVSIGAPGRSILSTTPNSTYSIFSGTSMAAPHVAGTAALVLSAYPNISVQNLRGVLAYSGEVLPALQEKTTTGRRLNAYNSLLSAAEGDTTPPSTVSDLRVTGQDGRSITLAWTAVGDDGNSGQAADYDFVFTNSNTGVVTVTPASLATLLPKPAGSQETATVQVPYRNFAGTIELRVYDNAGNVSRTPVSVTISVNAGSDPHQVTLAASTGVSTGGTALGLNADDGYRQGYTLPFAFPFFGQNRNSVTISTNGSLYFSNTVPKNDAGSSIEGLNGSPMIAGLWDDLRTDRRAGDDVYVTSDTDRIIFRWQAVTFDTPLTNSTTRGENPVNFEIELRRDGTIQTRYGAGNTRLFPVVGISGGEPDAYVVESHTSPQLLKNLTNAQTVTFTPRPATTTKPKYTQFDYDGDGRADISLFRPSNRVWYILNSGNSSVSYNQFGLSTDKIVPADFDGDGKTDVAVYRPENGTWYIMKSSGGVQYVQFGLAEDFPVPADYNGDGKAEIAVYRPSSGLWFILNSDTQQYSLVQFGASEDKPVPADYNGDGKTEIAVYRPSLGIWFIYNSDTKQYTSTKFGISSDRPVPADYNGDGKTDIAVYRPNEGNWYIATQSGGYTVTQFGISTDLPTPADYDGDGKTDIAVYRPSEGNWYQLKSKDGFNIFKFGLSEDKPVPNAYIR